MVFQVGTYMSEILILETTKLIPSCKFFWAGPPPLSPCLTVPNAAINAFTFPLPGPGKFLKREGSIVKTQEHPHPYLREISDFREGGGVPVDYYITFLGLFIRILCVTWTNIHLHFQFSGYKLSQTNIQF